MQSSGSLLFRVIAVLWVIWGVVHVLAGVLTITGDTQGALSAILDGVPAEQLAISYPPQVEGVVEQHGWNLMWFGLTTTIGAWFISGRNLTALWVVGLVGGMADLGYFLFLDLPGYVKFVPGTVMTLICGTAIVLSIIAWRSASSPQA